MPLPARSYRVIVFLCVVGVFALCVALMHEMLGTLVLCFAAAGGTAFTAWFIIKQAQRANAAVTRLRLLIVQLIPILLVTWALFRMPGERSARFTLMLVAGCMALCAGAAAIYLEMSARTFVLQAHPHDTRRTASHPARAIMAAVSNGLMASVLYVTAVLLLQKDAHWSVAVAGACAGCYVVVLTYLLIRHKERHGVRDMLRHALLYQLVPGITLYYWWGYESYRYQCAWYAQYVDVPLLVMAIALSVHGCVAACMAAFLPHCVKEACVRE